MKGTMIKGMIFDLDGTLIHTIEDIAWAANEMFTRNHLPHHPLSHYLEWIGSGAVKLIERALQSEVERDALMEYVAEFKQIYGENLNVRSRVYDGIPAVLDELVEKGISMAVLSNKPHALTLRVAGHYLSDWPFAAVFGQREEVPRKPDPAAALEIAGIMGLGPAEILFVGDSVNDILTSKAAGMAPLGVTWGYGQPAEKPGNGPVPLVNRPREILQQLNP